MYLRAQIVTDMATPLPDILPKILQYKQSKAEPNYVDTNST